MPSFYQPGVSVLIPAYNEEKNIANAIKSILDQTYKGDIEIIVLDDGSTDKTPEIAKKYPVRYIKLGNKPNGKTNAINKGIKIAKHDFICILDADSYLDKDALKEMMPEFQNKKVGAVIPIVRVHKPNKILEYLQLIEYTLSMSIRKIISNVNSLFITHGVGCTFRKSALFEVGLFETKTLTEDLNIGLKLVKKGYVLKSKFTAIGYTKVPSDTKGLFKQRLRWNGGLFENTFWFKELFFNKKYGNLGFFILPLNILWCIFTVYVAVNFVKDTFKWARNFVADLFLTNFDFNYLLSNYSFDLNLNTTSIFSILTLAFFIGFFLLVSKKFKFSFKDYLISFLLLPIYFSLYFLLNATILITTPIYLFKKGGKGWLRTT